MDELYKIMGKKLTALREKAGLTQEILSYRLNVTRVSVHNMESGKSQMTAKNLFLISVYLNCDIKDFFPNEQDNYVIEPIDINYAIEKSVSQKILKMEEKIRILKEPIKS